MVSTKVIIIRVTKINFLRQSESMNFYVFQSISQLFNTYKTIA